MMESLISTQRMKIVPIGIIVICIESPHTVGYRLVFEQGYPYYL